MTDKVSNVWGKYAVLTGVTHYFENEPEWWWKIKPPTTGNELALAQYMASERMVVLPNGSRMYNPITNLEIAIKEIALVFDGTNIPGENGTPLIERTMPIEVIEMALKDMPLPMVMELWYAVGDACPGWGPKRPDGSTRKPEEQADDEVGTPTDLKE